MPQLDLYNFFFIIFYSISGIVVIMFVFFQKHWLYLWKLLTLISNHINIKNFFNFIKFVFNFFCTLKNLVVKLQRLIFHISVENKKKKESIVSQEPHILVFWGFLVIVIAVTIYYGTYFGDGGDDSFDPKPPKPPFDNSKVDNLSKPSILPSDSIANALQKQVVQDAAEFKEIVVPFTEITQKANDIYIAMQSQLTENINAEIDRQLTEAEIPGINLDMRDEIHTHVNTFLKKAFDMQIRNFVRTLNNEPTTLSQLDVEINKHLLILTKNCVHNKLCFLGLK